MVHTALSVLALAAVACANNLDTDSNANPIRRVVSLLQGMAKTVEKEGAKEKELYDKFMCYCKNSGGDLQETISGSTAKVPELQSDIEESSSKLKQTKLDLKNHQVDRAAAKAAMGEATAVREKAQAKYAAKSAEYNSYISAMASAIPAIEKGMSGAFLQAKLGVGLTLQKALQSEVGQTTDYDKEIVASFLSGASSGSSGYVPKSGEITGILKEMKADFDKSLAEVEEDEAGQVKTFGELIAAKTKQVQALTSNIEKKSVLVGELQVSIVTMKNDLTETEAALIADQKFIADLSKNCAAKTGEMEERVKTRGDELVAIQETIKILNDDDALELFKKTLPSASLLQPKASSAVSLRKALTIVQHMKEMAKGGRPELDLLAMALSGRGVDFSKVVKMIDDMVALLKTEQVDDDSKKEYCEMQLDMVEDKAKDLTAKVEDLKVAIEEKNEIIKVVTGELKELAKSIKKLDKSVMDSTYQRKGESEEYTELMSGNNAAKELLNFAKNRLNKFYNPKLYKAPAKAEATEFVQISLHNNNDNGVAPAPPPETFGAYSKKSGETTGVIQMVDLLIRDLDKEMTEAKAEEQNAQKEYEEMMNDSAVKRAADTKAIAAKEAAKAEAETGLVNDEESKMAEFNELTATKQYEGQLHSECDWLMQNFALRKSMRADEMDNLKQAKAVLSGADFSLLQTRNLRGM